MAVIIQNGLVPTITLTGRVPPRPPRPTVITTSATEIKDIPVDTSDVGDGKVLTYDAATDTLVFITPTGEGGGDSFDQDLNTTDDVQFESVTIVVDDNVGVEINSSGIDMKNGTLSSCANAFIDTAHLATVISVNEGPITCSSTIDFSGNDLLNIDNVAAQSINNSTEDPLLVNSNLDLNGHDLLNCGNFNVESFSVGEFVPLSISLAIAEEEDISYIQLNGGDIRMNDGDGGGGGNLLMDGGNLLMDGGNIHLDGGGIFSNEAITLTAGDIEILSLDSELGTIVTSPDLEVCPFSIKGAISQIEDFQQWKSWDDSVYSRIDSFGRFVTKAISAPENAELSNHECAIWFDSTAGEIKFKGKKSNGVVVDAAPTGGGGGGFEFDINNNLDIGIENDVGHISSLATVSFDFTNIESISDGNTIILTNTEGDSFTYEFDNNSSVTGENIAVTFVDTEGYDAAGAAASFYAVVNGGEDFDITLDESSTSGVITQKTPGSEGNTSLDGDLSGSIFGPTFENGVDDSENQISIGFGLTSDFENSIVMGISDTKITIFDEFATIALQADNGINIANQLQIGNTNSESIIYQQAYLAQEDTGEVIWTYNLTPNGHSINLSSDTAYKISMSGTGGANGIQFHGNAANNNDWNANKVLLFNIKNTGQAISTGSIGTAATSAPADGDVANNQVYLWWQDGATVSFKGKDNGGGIQTGSFLTKNTDINMNGNNITNIDTISGEDENWTIPSSGQATFTSLMLTDLPTDDPGNAGEVWNDNGTLMISTGPGS